MYCSKCGNEQASELEKCPHCGEKRSVLNVTSGDGGYKVASQMKRLANNIIDYLFILIFSGIVGIFAAMIGLNTDSPDSNSSFIRGFLLIIIYYIIFEYFFQKTPAKFITKTKVVSQSGDRASLLNIVGRTFARYIPFEAFSFLSNKYPIGWHDKLSKTIVVSDKYTKEDILKISPSNEKKSALLIVVVVIFFTIIVVGLLSTFSIIALNSARSKARNAERVSNVRQIEIALELYYDDNTSYPETLGGLNAYLKDIPQNPKPNDGDCDENSEFKYSVLNSNHAYTLDFCLGEATGSFNAGNNTIKNTDAE